MSEMMQEAKPKKAGRPPKTQQAIVAQMEALKAQMAQLEAQKKAFAKEEEDRKRREKAAAQEKLKKELQAKQDANFAAIGKLIKAQKLHHVDVSIWQAKSDQLTALLK
jgi:hypothetical protein